MIRFAAGGDNNQQQTFNGLTAFKTGGEVISEAAVFSLRPVLSGGGENLLQLGSNQAALCTENAPSGLEVDVFLFISAEEVTSDSAACELCVNRCFTFILQLKNPESSSFD